MKANSCTLSDSQMGIYYEWEKDKSLMQYNLPFCYDFPENTDPARIKSAFEKTIDTHPILKSRLRMEGEDVVLCNNDGEPAEITMKRADEHEMKRIISGFVRPFDLIDNPLYRIELYICGKKLCALLDFHHIIFDGYSLAVFNRDLVKAYDGKELEPESFTLGDFAKLENSLRGNEEYLESKAYFEKRLNGRKMTELPTTATRSDEPGYMQIFREYINAKPVDDFCFRLRITPNSLFSGALGIALAAYTSEREIGFCTAHHGRLDKRLQNSIGMFVKTLPVMINVLPEQKVKDYLANIRSDLKELWGKLAFPFSGMVKNFGISMEIAFTFQAGLDQYFELDSKRIDFTLIRPVKSNSSLLIYVAQTYDGDYEIRYEYNDKLYSHEYIATFAASVRNVLLNMMEDENRACRDISLISGEEEEKIRRISSGEDFEHDRTTTLVDLFREQAQKTPDNIAVVYKGTKLSYRDLDLLTDRIARNLCASGLKREGVAGVMTDRSEYMVIFPLAIMKAGAAYMPLDFTMPPDRLNFMVSDAGASHILSEGSRVADLLPGFKGVVFNREDLLSPCRDVEIILPKPAPADMFVLLYTSGSTGNPKGCILEHRNMVNFCRWYAETYNITAEDRSTAYANFAFDAHLSDFYPFLSTGASVYVIPAEIRMDLIKLNQYMEENGLNIALFTTQIGRQFAEEIENRSLRLLSVGGERLPPMKKPPYRLYNLYGPTECTICSTFYNIEKDYTGSVIGRSIGNVTNYIMDHNMQLLPVGVAGELCIGGEGVGRAYLQRDDLTREKFITWKGQKLYRTGDLARYNASGEIEYIGRLDNQVKLRGLRIEPGEIENAMLAFDGISSAVVDVKEIAGVQRLCGYYISKTSIPVEEIKDWLRKTLADFMIPSELIRMEKFPLTSNGKVNRKALPLPQSVQQEEYVEPSGEIEQNICKVFSDVLNTEKPGALDNFFNLGGSSITAIKAIIRIANLGYHIQYGDFFKLKTPRAIASFLSDGKHADKKKEVANLEDLSDYDYSAINKLLGAGKPDLWNNFTEFEPGDVLLTGSTGYLGIHVLKELINKENGRIYCMVRPKGSLTPEMRLKTLLTYYFSEPLDEFFQSRIIPVIGDITDVSALKQMKGRGIKTVINCAASVKHFESGNEINKINFDGVCNLLDYCREEGSRLIHVSTLSTAGIIEKDNRGRDVMMDESKLYIGQKIDNMYVLSKFKAERAVLQAICEGLDGKIMRVGNLMGRFTDGEFQVNFRSNAFVNALKAYKVLGMFPLSRLTSSVEISPIDCAATAIVALMKAPSSIHIAHAYNNYRLNMANLIYAMKLHGFDIELVSDNVFEAHFQDVLKNPRKSEYISGLLHYRISENYVEMPDNNDYTTTLLYKYGFRWPVPGEDYSIRLIKVLDGMGFFDEDMGR